MTTPATKPLSRPHRRFLVALVGVAIGGVMRATLVLWIVVSGVQNWDVVFTARAANVCGLAILTVMIFGPLTLRRYPLADRLRGFVLVWFVVSPFFNATWQLPLILFRDTITGAEVTRDNLPRLISWWGYGSVDTHYGTVSSFMIASELWWLVAMLIGIVGLARLISGATHAGYLLMGIAGALQAYNASFYVVDNGMVDGFDNVATDSIMGPLLYFGFAALWVGAALTASVLSFRGASAATAAAARAAVATTPEPARVADVVDERLDVWGPVAESHGRRLSRPEPAAAVDDVSVDLGSQDLGQLLDVALDNAIRCAGPDAAITVTARLSDEMVELLVRDDGPGMEDGQWERAAERFWRGRTDLPGSGLGLSIAREIVEGNHGRFAVRSADGGGTEVSFALPRHARKS